MLRLLVFAFIVVPCMVTRTWGQAGSHAAAGVGGVSVTDAKCEVRDRTLELRYVIRNDLDQDIWLCDRVAACFGGHFEAILGEDRRTLIVRRRLELPTEVTWQRPPTGRYTRLRAGQSRNECLLLALPVFTGGVFTGGADTDGMVGPERVNVEIGYFAGDDLFHTVLGLIGEVENARRTGVSPERFGPHSLLPWCRGGLLFNTKNEDLRSRSQHLLIPWSSPALGAERVIRIPFKMDGLRIAYPSREVGEPERAPDLLRVREPFPLSPTGPRIAYGFPDSTQCSRMEIRFQPSIFGYFFSEPADQTLFTTQEKESLSEQTTVTIDDQRDLLGLCLQITFGGQGNVIVADGGTAKIVCYDGDRMLTSFTVYREGILETETGTRFCYDLGQLHLGRFIHQIEPFESRVRCAQNLRNLWYRFRLFRRASKVDRSDYSLSDDKSLYPDPSRWSEALKRVYCSTTPHLQLEMRSYACPAAAGGPCHYAMNPNCMPNSHDDTVLLFETKAGWNQHGGPHLFTFDNHDPKGGCVLLNDGTVNFIRTEAELDALRWK